jgi:hypothetical protein
MNLCDRYLILDCQLQIALPSNKVKKDKKKLKIWGDMRRKSERFCMLDNQ